MSKFDFVLLGILAVFIAFGAWRGLVREVISIVTWILAGVLAWFFAAPLSNLFKGFLDEAAMRQVLAFALIFVAVFALGLVASWLIHKYLPSKRGFRIANVALGGLIGAARGAVIIVLVFLVAGLTSAPQQDWWRESAVAPYFERAAVTVSHYMPRDIARHIRYS